MASRSTNQYEHIHQCIFPMESLTDGYYPGCQCRSCANPLCCCMSKSGGHIVYEKGMLNIDGVHTDTPVYECNSNCVCDVTCTNRVVQKGGLSCIEVFDTNAKGLGLRTTLPIISGQFVIEFVGEVIKVKECKQRLSALGEADSCYILILKEHAGDLKTFITCIDATSKGNESRFINHSCQPNLMLIPVRVNSIVPHLCLFSQRDVGIGEELTYDYSGGNKVIATDRKSAPCLCGTVHCRGVLPYQDV